MNNLEKELEEIFGLIGGSDKVNAVRAKSAAHIAMREIHEAYLAGVSFTAWLHQHGSEPKPPNLQEYMAKFNGLTPTEPDTKEAGNRKQWNN